MNYTDKANHYFKRWDKAIEAGKSIDASKYARKYLRAIERAKVYAKQIGE